MSLDLMAEKIQKALEKRPLDHSIKFDCGANGQMVLDGDRARMADDPADCTIKISKANLEKLLTGKLNPVSAFAMGKIKVSGDMSVALKLGQLLG